jgi:hypothetical protein
MRKLVSDQTVEIKEDDGAQTAREIMQKKGFVNKQQVYDYLDTIAADGYKVVSCKVWRKNRCGTLHRTEAYYIEG